MKHTLYTTYLSKMKNIPEGKVVAVIMRMPPISIQQYEYIIHVPQLSPKKELLLKYKKNNNWEEFEQGFLQQLDNDKETKEYFDFLVDALNHNDVYLVCCEKDPNVCHRTIIGNRIKEYGFNHIEL